MKRTITLLSIIAFLTITGCASAQQPAKKEAPKPTMNQDQVVDNIRARIAEYNKPIADAKKQLEATPEWQEYLKAREVYNAAVEAFREADKKASAIPELKTLNYLQTRQLELKRLLEGGK